MYSLHSITIGKRSRGSSSAFLCFHLIKQTRGARIYIVYEFPSPLLESISARTILQWSQKNRQKRNKKKNNEMNREKHTSQRLRKWLWISFLPSSWRCKGKGPPSEFIIPTQQFGLMSLQVTHCGKSPLLVLHIKFSEAYQIILIFLKLKEWEFF